MVEVYYYIPAEEAGKVVECGIKLSKWFDKEVVMDGEPRKCLSAYLNPKDHLEKYKSRHLTCLKLEVAPSYCYVADSALYRVGMHYPEVMALYQQSIIPVQEYIFGSYRLPECLVTSTVLEGKIGVLDKRLDSPILFDNSENLYVSNLMERYKEENEDFNDVLLYFFYSKLAQLGKIDKIEDNDQKTAVFIDRMDGKVYCTKIPNLSRYSSEDVIKENQI